MKRNKEIKKAGKRVTILFSGGLDSTYLVWKNLKDGNEVYPIYIDIENNKTKAILEKNRIKLLFEKFRNEFSYKINPIQYILKLTVDVNAREDSLYFKQVPIWLLAILFSQGNYTDEIQIGYVCNDDAIPYLKDIKNIYKSYQCVSEKLKPLKFPLTKHKKWEMIRQLPKEYSKLIVSCEYPTIIGSEDANYIEYEPCCDCVPCKSIISSNYYETRDFPKIYEKNMIKNHAHELRRKGLKVLNADGTEYFNESLCSVKTEPYQLKIPFNYFKSPEVPFRDMDRCEIDSDDGFDDDPVEIKKESLPCITVKG